MQAIMEIQGRKPDSCEVCDSMVDMLMEYAIEKRAVERELQATRRWTAGWAMAFAVALVLAALGTGCGSGPNPDATGYKGAQFFFDEGVTLPVDALSEVLKVATDAANYNGNLEDLRLYVRGGSFFYCNQVKVDGCSYQDDMAISAQNPRTCAYFLVAHELGHWLAFRKGDGDINHKGRYFTETLPKIQAEINETVCKDWVIP